MSKHTISMDDAEWDALVADSIRATVRLNRVVSVSEYIRIIAREARADEQSTRADAQPTGQGGSAAETYAREYFRWCPRERCRAQGREEHGGYCSASHRLADEQRRAAYG